MKVKKPTQKDQTKERIFKELSSILEGAGFVVRREELKRGYGWKVVSGSCRLVEDKIIFIDRRMTQEDQLSFLTGRILALGVTPSEDQRNRLSDAGWSLEFPGQAA